MRLTELEIHALPGIEPGFRLTEMDAGVNVVTGPNAIGKSSLIRALRYLLVEPAVSDPHGLVLKAVFDNGEQRLVRRTASQQRWEVAGQRAESPPLPDADALRCYWLSMEDLLEQTEGDRELVARLRRDLAGGFDLPALRRRPFEVRPRIGEREKRELREAVRALRKVESEYRALQDEEARLPELEERIGEAQQAQVRADQLDKALQLSATLTERAEIEAGMSEFPEHMEKLRGDEVERLKTLASRREKSERTIESVRQQNNEALRRLHATGLKGRLPEERSLGVQSENLQRAQRFADQAAEKHNRLVKVRAAAEEARERLGGLNAVPELTPEAIGEAEELARQLDACQRKQGELAARMKQAEAPGDGELDRVRQAVMALREWLAREAAGGKRPLVPWLVAVTGGLLAILAGLLAASWIAVAGGVVALGGAVWGGITRYRTGVDPARRRFEESGAAPPASWAQNEVAERLESLEAQYAGLRDAAERASRAVDLQRELEDIDQEIDRLREQKNVLAERLGFDPKLTALGLDHFIRYAEAWHRAATELRRVSEEAEDLETQRDEAADKVSKFLLHWGLETRAALEELRASLDDLDRRRRNAEESIRDAEHHDDELKRLQGEVSRIRNEESAVYEEVGLAAGERRALDERLEQLEQWRDQRVRLWRVDVLERERREALEGDAQLLEWVEANERETLESERDRTKELADRLERLQEERTTIRNQLDAAGGDHHLAEALEEVDAARSALEDRCNEALFAEAGQFLLDEVEEEHHSTHEPAVLADARDRFRRFTHQAWDIELDESEGLIARDLRLKVVRRTDQMSSATRMQLLLAVRLAWLRHREHGRESLPLFLDEALTTSDETRFAVVATSLEQLARDEGRQVFYLCARCHELGLWEQSTGHRPHHVDLARIRNWRDDADEADFVLPEFEALPEPGEQSPEEYAAMLGVPRADPRQSAGSLHLFYLLRDDLPLLHRLMDIWRVTSLGQIKALLESDVADKAIPDQDLRERLASRCALASVWVDVWRRGRGRPVDRSALEASGAISDKFIDRISDLAHDLDGNADSLMEVLRDTQRDERAKGFRSDRADKLEQWLETEGYIDADDPLDVEERLRAVLARSGGQSGPEDVQRVVAWLEASLTTGDAAAAAS